MCGICGQFNFESLAPVRRSDIEAMYTVDADLVNRNKGDWLEVWNKEIGPLFKQ